MKKTKPVRKPKDIYTVECCSIHAEFYEETDEVINLMGFMINVKEARKIHKWLGQAIAYCENKGIK